MTVLNEADKLYLGNQIVDTVYADEKKVWPAWAPIDIPELAAWIDADQDTFADGQQIDTYVEHSSGKWVFNSFSPGKGPVFRIGEDKPYLEFPSYSEGGLVSATPWNSGPLGLTFMFVGQIYGGSYPMMMVWGPTANGIEMRHDGSAQQVVICYTTMGIYFSHPVTSGGLVDALYALRVDSIAGHTDIWTNTNKFTDHRAPRPMPNIDQTLWIGRRQEGYPFIGRVYEALAFAGPISDADQQKLESYLRGKWGLA